MNHESLIIQNSVIQNLKDAGCNQEIISAFVKALEAERIEEGLKILAAHRRTLLDNLHKEQKRIDYLDYLVYHMKKVCGKGM